jgi:hypothetical protein
MVQLLGSVNGGASSTKLGEAGSCLVVLLLDWVPMEAFSHGLPTNSDGNLVSRLKLLCHAAAHQGVSSQRSLASSGPLGVKSTEPEAGNPPRGSGRHVGQQRGVPEQEPPPCSAANHSSSLQSAVASQPASGPDMELLDPNLVHR